MVYAQCCATGCQLSASYCMLTHLEFESLAFGQQDAYVRAHGHYLAQRWHENYSIELYELEGFYCELWLEQECVVLPRYLAFASDTCLALFTQQVHLLH
jgi:hypothetical protein